MSEIKTKVNDASVTDFLANIEDEIKRQDSFKLLELFTEVTGEQPKMWGSSIIGFGQYHYKSERSSQEGDWMLTGFSPRKQNLTLYLIHGFENSTAQLEKLGKHKLGKGCLYFNKLADVDETTLKGLIKQAYSEMKKEHANE